MLLKGGPTPMRTCGQESEQHMGFDVSVTDAFEGDLREIPSYLIEEKGSVSAARNVMNAIDEAKELISACPYINAISKKARFSGRPYREHFIRGYVIVYKVVGNDILFLRLFHQAQLYERFVMEWE